MGGKVIYNSGNWEVEYDRDSETVSIYYDDGEKRLDAELQKKGGKLVSTGTIILRGAQIWSWTDDGSMNGLFWARVFDNFSGIYQVLTTIFEKTSITFEDFKDMLLRDIKGVVYHVTGDNETWESIDTGVFDTAISYEKEYIESNCPEYLDVFNKVVSLYGPRDAEEEVIERVGELVRDDIEKAENLLELEEVLVFDWDSEYVAEAEKVFVEKLWEELGKHGVVC